MSITYRNGTADDAAAVSRLFTKAFIATFGHIYSRENLDMLLAVRQPENFRERLSRSEWGFRIAEEDGAVIGYAMAGPNELPGELIGPTWELHHLYLDEAAKGRGVADDLMEWVKGEARRRGFTQLQLSVFIDNHRARRFYDKRGFIEIGRYDFMVGNHVDDDRVMRLAL